MVRVESSLIFLVVHLIKIVNALDAEDIIPAECNTNTDLVIILDSSESIGEEIWPKEVEFAEKVAERFNVAPHNDRIGVIEFSTKATVRVDLNKPEGSSPQKIKAALEFLKTDFQKGVTHTDFALEKAVHMFNNIPTGRLTDMAAKLLIIVTDGKATDRRVNGVRKTGLQLISKYVKELKAMGITTIAIGVGNGVPKNELEFMASSRSQVLQVSDFDTLLSQINPTLQKLCPQRCYRPVDLIILLDCSGSIGWWNWYKELTFARNLIDRFRIGATKTHVGVLAFHEKVSVAVNLTQEGWKMSTISASIKSMLPLWKPHMRTYTDVALNKAITMIEEAKQARGVPKIVVMVTDGRSSNGMESLIKPVERLKKMDAHTYCVGVGPSIDIWELRYIANKTDNVFQIKNFNQLLASLRKIASKLCYGR